jgi:MFS family permease
MCQRYFSDRAASDPTFQFHQIILGGENPQCQDAEVQRKVALFTMGLNVTVGILSALTAPRIGALSDRWGRKRLMVICGLGGISSEFITILCARYPEVVHYRWLMLGSVLDGLAGSFTAGSLLSHSYTSDSTPPSGRGLAIGYLHSCLFTGLALGPLLAGYLVRWTGSLLAIFYVVLGCHLAFITYIFLVLPESVSKRRQLVAREKHAKELQTWQAQGLPGWLVPLGSIPLGTELAHFTNTLIGANPFAPLRVLLPRGPNASTRLRINMVVLSAIDVCILGAAMGATTVIILYSELLFSWGTFETSRFISLVAVVRVFVLAVIFPIINYIFRARPLAKQRRASVEPVIETNAGADPLDLWILRAALLSDIIGVTGYVFVRTPELFILSGAITAVGGLGSATIQAVITKHVPADRVGAVFGAIGQLHALSRVVAPMVFNGIYAATVKSFPQAFFILLASLFVMSFFGAFAVRPHREFRSPLDPTSSVHPGSLHHHYSNPEGKRLHRS